MRAVRLPPVPYHDTAQRPAWPQLPAALRGAVEARLGAPVRSARVAGAGFTRGFAGVLETGTGDRVFVKAASASDQPHLVDWYAHEATVLARLPAGLPVPRPRWALQVADWYALGLTAIDGRVPDLPWAPDELAATLAGYAEVATALAQPPPGLVALGLPRLSELAREDLAWWREVAAGREPLPGLPAPDHPPPPGATRPAPEPAGVLPGLELAAVLPELVALESRLPGYAATGGLVHGDLRLDNVLLDRAGRAWFCDWTWLCHGPAWFDLVGLLLTGYASGLDVDGLFAGHPAAADAPPDALDVTLAALSGYFLTAGGSAPSTASPHIRSHQRFSGDLALAWLADRRGWR